MLYETMQKLYQKLEERGKAEGEANMLIHILETKFGALDAKVRASLEQLDSETLLKCSERLFTAQTVNEVLG